MGSMESILNFRDVEESVNEFIKGIIRHSTVALSRTNLRKGVLFRSGELDKVSKQDLEKLLGLDIRTVVDLRSGSCGYELSLMEKEYPCIEYRDYSIAEGGSEDSFIRGKSPRRTVNINFAGEKYKKKSISSAPFFVKMKIKFYSLFRQRIKAAQMMAQALAPGGLTKMYKNLLDTCEDQIIKVLEIMKDKSNLPILIHCKYGKDYTGVIIAILLSLCGIDDEIIVQDYVISKRHLASVYPLMVEDMRKIGLTESFADVPPEAMKDLLSYIKDQHYSTQNYLVKIGFDLKDQQLVRRNLLEEN